MCQIETSIRIEEPEVLLIANDRIAMPFCLAVDCHADSNDAVYTNNILPVNLVQANDEIKMESRTLYEEA